MNGVLCVDLDGTLTPTNLLYEAVLELARSRPLMLFILPFWWLWGQAYLWDKLIRLVCIEVSHLPVSEEVLALVRKASRQGRQTILVTGTHRTVAEAVAQHFECFDAVIATEMLVHLAGRAKAEALISRFGTGNFDYVGNSAVDLPVWNLAGRAILAPSVSERVFRRLSPEKQSTCLRLAGNKQSYVRCFLRALRPHQWAKNLLVLVPLLLSHQWSRWGSLSSTLVAFLSFCLASSGTYLTNDLLDVSADRAHPIKRNRPVASGDLPIPMAIGGAIVLCLSALWIAYAVKLALALLIGFYLVLTLAYSVRLKTVMLLDTMLLSGFYTLRIFTGGAAASVSVSPWTLAFAMFLFLSLALMKRCSELTNMQRAGARQTSRRGYVSTDLAALTSLGTSLGVVAALIIALYISGADVRSLYRAPDWLWLLCPALLMWVCRLWIVTGRGEMHEDPIAFALKDKCSLAIGGFVMLAWLFAL